MKSDICERIIVIGTTKIFKLVCDLVANQRERFKLTYISYDNSCKQATCSLWDGVYEERVIDIEKELLALSEPTLVINAGSYYIYSKKLIQKNELKIINYHNALLPDYKGINASSWVIFNQEKYTGVTWHEVTDKIDEGQILGQTQMEIFPDEKAYELNGRQVDAAYHLFEKMWNKWLRGECWKAERFDINGRNRLFYSREIPNNGIIDLRTDDAETIYRTLRALDYGKFSPFPQTVVVAENGKRFFLTRYRKIEKKDMSSKEDENTFYINLGKKIIKIMVKNIPKNKEE